MTASHVTMPLVSLFLLLPAAFSVAHRERPQVEQVQQALHRLEDINRVLRETSDFLSSVQRVLPRAASVAKLVDRWATDFPRSERPGLYVTLRRRAILTLELEPAGTHFEAHPLFTVTTVEWNDGDRWTLTIYGVLSAEAWPCVDAHIDTHLLPPHCTE